MPIGLFRRGAAAIESHIRQPVIAVVSNTPSVVQSRPTLNKSTLSVESQERFTVVETRPSALESDDISTQ